MKEQELTEAKRWNRWYFLVLGILVLEIVLGILLSNVY